jgi:hypothetical protein
MSIDFRKFAAVIGGGIIIMAVVLFLFSLQHEIPPPPGWPASVKLYRRTLTGDTTAIDSESGRVLFSYLPEYDRNVHPIKIEKIDPTHWQVVFEVPARQ